MSQMKVFADLVYKGSREDCIQFLEEFDWSPVDPSTAFDDILSSMEHPCSLRTADTLYGDPIFMESVEKLLNRFEVSAQTDPEWACDIEKVKSDYAKEYSFPGASRTYLVKEAMWEGLQSLGKVRQISMQAVTQVHFGQRLMGIPQGLSSIELLAFAGAVEGAVRAANPYLKIPEYEAYLRDLRALVESEVSWRGRDLWSRDLSDYAERGFVSAEEEPHGYLLNAIYLLQTYDRYMYRSDGVYRRFGPLLFLLRGEEGDRSLSLGAWREACRHFPQQSVYPKDADSPRTYLTILADLSVVLGLEAHPARQYILDVLSGKARVPALLEEGSEVMGWQLRESL